MLKLLSLAVALGFSSVTIAQQPQTGPAKPDAKAESPTASQQGAAGGASRSPCDVMSREEMQMCKRTKTGDVSGARSSLCDVVGADVIESCLKPPESGSSDAANKGQEQQPR